MVENTDKLKDQVFVYTDSKLYFEDPVDATDKALELMNRLIEDRPDYKWLRMQRAYVYFLKSDFKKANDNFAVYVRKSEALFHNLCLKYAPKVREDGKLGIEDLLSMLQTLVENSYLTQALMIASHDSVTRSSLDERLQMMKLLLSAANLQWRGELTYDKKTAALKISGSHLNVLGIKQKWAIDNSSVCLINLVPVKKLDLSGTEIYSLKYLSQLPLLEELDVSSTLVYDLRPLGILKSLKKLIISPKQFPAKKIIGDMKDFQVVIKKE